MASLFNHIIQLKETISTNSYAHNLLKEKKIKQGAVICAKYQSKGRGQVGANWESENGKNILMSIVLSPDILLKNQFEINICISLALHDFTKKYFLERAKIKWPNDLLIEDKKIAGILIENTVKKDKVKDTVIGIGLNVNQIKFADYLLEATSFTLELDKDFAIKELQTELLDCTENRYQKLKQGKTANLKAEYLDNLYGLNQWKNYKLKGKKIKEKIVGIDEVGKLLLEFENEKIKSFFLKEITYLY